MSITLHSPVGTGGTIHAPATNTLNIGVNNTESLRIDSNSNLKVAGIALPQLIFMVMDQTYLEISAGTSLSDQQIIQSVQSQVRMQYRVNQT